MNKTSIPIIIVGGLVGVTACTGLALTSISAHADNDSVTDDVSITVPVSCTMSGSIATGQEHTATLYPGTYSGASGSEYENGIGKTTLTTFCNDSNGFSIYAVGFTGDAEGDNTLLGANTGFTIPTKVYESTDSTSNWSMKVTKVDDSSVAYNPANMSITNDFNAWHTVPDDYTKVAEYHASTGSSATDRTLGAKVETTYASYVATNQPADTYAGQVKYVMVHPYSAAPPSGGIKVTYNGNGLTFPGGAATNTVTYGRDCTAEGSYYVGNTPTIVKSPNIADDGTQNGPYYTNEDVYVLEHVSFQGADRLKVVLRYGLTAGYSAIDIMNGIWNDTDNWPEEGTYHEYYSETDNQSGTETLIIDEDTITVLMEGWGTPETDYDYGMYAEVYPVYDSETSCPIGPTLAGTYTEPTGFSYWYLGDDKFLNEASVINYISQNIEVVSSTGTTINASNSYLIMQDVFSWGSSLSQGQEVSAIDSRDNKSYSVARLADGNLWMTQNLDHDIVTTPGFYTNQNTDLGWNTQTNSYDQASWDPIPSAYTHDSTSQYEWGHYGNEFPDYDYQYNVGTGYNSDVFPESYNPGNVYWDGELWNGNDSTATHRAGSGNFHHHLGNSYNWAAAVATNDGSQWVLDPSLSLHLIEQSICPTGWTLPRSYYGEDSFYSLIRVYDDAFDGSSYKPLNESLRVWEAPLFHTLIYGGYNLYDFLPPTENSGSHTLYWSAVGWMDSDYVGEANAFYVLYDSENNYVGFSDTNLGPSYAGSVRCIARPVSNILVVDKP